MRENAPCPAQQATGAICDTCIDHGVGYCQAGLPTRDAIRARLAAKIERVMRPGSRTGMNLTHDEARVLADLWNTQKVSA